MLKFNDFPESATKLMVVNNGLNKLVLDAANYGGGFNLNLVCFMTAATEGQT